MKCKQQLDSESGWDFVKELLLKYGSAPRFDD